VFNVSLATDGKACCLEPSHAELYSIEGHHLFSLVAQVIDKPGETKHSLRNLGLEHRVASEYDN
jgi:hypothetical protein